MNPNPAKLAGFDLEDKATNEILQYWQDFKALGCKHYVLRVITLKGKHLFEAN